MPERQNIEYKKNWHENHLKWICGFANSKGGKLYIGIDDNGKVLGINNYQELMEQLPNKFRDILGIYAEINLHVKKNKHYLEIIIPRYDVPISLRGKYYIRTGSTLQELTGPALNEFILKRTGKNWDDIQEKRATIEDIDEQTIKQFLEDARKANRVNIEADIKTTDLLDKLRLIEDGNLKRGALILFGNDPGKFYPNTAVKIGKFGKSDADLKFHEVLEGNLIQLKQTIEETLNSKFFIHPIDFKGMQRVEKDEYPVAAVREMVLNALVHRNYMGSQTQIRLYDDNFGIWNDGGLPAELTEEDLKRTHRSKPGNPIIADVCFKAGYIDTWGRGTIKIIEACKEHKLPEPVLKEEQGGFLTKIFKDIFTKENLEKLGLNNRQIKGVLYTKEKGSINNSLYQELNGIGKTTATEELQELVQKGILLQTGTKGRGIKYTIS
ncbi:MAG: putative DNA binding domain-containing protein [Bacteroidales bacterium]|nr:putative DNA binding domain-containing protein [Bacteroidales bacterium]MCF8336690.1 putative DNA binding domain-containing protein [Bacteroidales bacterium]